MSNTWDRPLKELVGMAPQDFVSWLLGEGHYVKECSPQLQGRSVEADILEEVVAREVINLLHIEFQIRPDSSMGKRLEEYNSLASNKHKSPVWSVVIYLKPGGKIVESPYIVKRFDGKIIKAFYFDTIKLWEYTSEEIRQMGLKGLIPLLPLTKDSVLPKVLDEIFEELNPPGQVPEKDLLSIAFGFLTSVFNGAEDQALIRKRYIMVQELFADSWLFNELREEAKAQGLAEGKAQGREQGLEQGLEKGLEQGLEKGLEQGLEQARKEELERARQSLYVFVEARFPGLLALAKERGALIEDPVMLLNLVIKVGLAPHVEEAQRYLLQVDNS